MNTPKYTFLLPAFKARFLAQTLDSIQKQTYTDFKVIISDDCSPEAINLICEPYLVDERFTYRKNAENVGATSVVAHWNLLVELCDTKYLIMASDDDTYEPTFLEEIDNLTIKYPQVALFRARINRVDEDGNVFEHDMPCDEYESHLDFCYHLFAWNGIHCMQNYVFKTSVLKEIGGCIELPLAWYSDDATEVAMSQYGVANTRKALFLFRSSTIQISSNEKIPAIVARKKVEAGILFLKWIRPFIEKIKTDNSKYEQNIKSKLRVAAPRYIAGHAKYYYAFLSFRDYLSFYTDFVKEGFVKARIEKYMLFKNWLKYHLLHG